MKAINYSMPDLVKEIDIIEGHMYIWHENKLFLEHLNECIIDVNNTDRIRVHLWIVDNCIYHTKCMQYHEVFTRNKINQLSLF